MNAQQLKNAILSFTVTIATINGQLKTFLMDLEKKVGAWIEGCVYG